MTADPRKVRTRSVGHLHLDTPGHAIAVDHVYAPDGVLDGDGTGHDPGRVGLVVKEGEHAGSVLLTASQALSLANRLTRAASLVLESGEDPADVEREAARVTRA